MKFKEIPGHNDLKARLARGVDEGRVSHAQLFTGRSGYGTLALALAYVQYVNCTDRRDGDSCGECPSCHKIAALAHPDVHFVFPVNSEKSGAKKPLSDAFLPQWRELWGETEGVFDEQEWYRAIGLDNQQGLITRNEADEIIRKLSFKSFEARYKAVIVWLPEKMREEAANALLKILEEPWERTLFLLVSEDAGRLLPTIISRTQEVSVAGVAEQDIARHIAERYGLDEAAAGAIARAADGDILEARRAAGGGTVSEAEYFDLFAQLMRLSYNDKHMELLDWADGVAGMGREEQKRFLQYCVRLLRDSYMMNAGMDSLTNLRGDELGFCKKFSPFIGNHNIEKLVSEMELTLAQIIQNGNAKIIFAHFALAVSKLIVKI
ncbi:DNA polymerase III subunit delta [Alistipes sp. OttesenSCG-928-B03]|nr:DNA polymerase III subunit delta [Alistipes sp. OttesenSCG-928-B03]